MKFVSQFIKVSILSLCLLVISSCNHSKNELNCVSFVTNKKVLIDKNSNTASVRYNFNNNYYPVERDIYFDANGYITKIGISKGEGLLFYYRKPKKNQLELNEEHQNFRIQYNGDDNFIIENNDTLKSVEVNCDDKIISVKIQRTGRIIIYSFE